MDAVFMVLTITFCASSFGVPATHFDRAFLPDSKLMTEAFINREFCHKNKTQVVMISSQSVGWVLVDLPAMKRNLWTSHRMLNRFCA
jgi:hypothetical protein